jgi:hypothetical protein
LTAIQVGVLVFLFPLYLFTRAGLGPKAVGTVGSLSVRGRLMALWLGGTASDRWGRMLAFPELPREYEPHSVREVHFIQWEQPRLLIDISETMELKLEAIRCHASQIGDFKDFEARMRNRAVILGKEKGYAYAEGFDQIVVPG